MRVKREMSHDEAFAALDAAALDALDVGERDAVLSHASSCDACRVELARLREAVALLAFGAQASSDPADRRERIHARLMARASAGTSNAPPAIVAEITAKPARVINMLAWRRAETMAIAASVLLVVSAAVLASVLRDRETLRSSLQDQTTRIARMTTAGDSMRTALMTRDSIIAGLTGKDVAMMTLTSQATRSPMGHMFWDKRRNTWTLVAHDLPELKPGRTYQLWLMTPTQKISAGTFMAPSGDAMMRATYALSPADLMAVAVTDEPMGGMPQPTGPMVMLANAH